MSYQSMRLRIAKQKRFFKPFEIQFSENHCSYKPLTEKSFWTENGARKYLVKTFCDEIDKGASVVKKVHIYKD